MRQILTLVFIFVHVCFAQKATKETFIVAIERNSTGAKGVQETYYIALQTLGQAARGGQQMTYTIEDLEVRDAADSMLKFSYREQVMEPDFMNSSRAVEYMCMLNKPIPFLVQDGIPKLDSLPVRQYIEKQLDRWVIESEVGTQLVGSIYSSLKELMHHLYFSNLSKKFKPKFVGKTAVVDNTTYAILKNGKGERQVSFTKTDSTSTQQAEVRYDPRNAMIKKLDSKISFSLKIDNRQINGETNLHVEQTAYIRKGNVRSDYLDMLMRGSYWSDALKEKGKTDSLKVEKYIASYEPNYSNNRLYAGMKLGSLQKADSYKRYRAELNHMPISLLRGTFHLSNKLNDEGLSMEDLTDLIPLLREGDLYDFLHNTLAQRLLDKQNKQAFATLLHINANMTAKEKLETDPLVFWAKSLRTPQMDSVQYWQKIMLGWDQETWNKSNAGRYALLLQQILIKKNLNHDADLQMIIDKIQRLVEDPENKRRLTHKGLLAYAYYLQYETKVKTNEEQALASLERAAFYSPKGAADKARESFYDRVFLLSKENYTNDYIEELSKRGQSDVALEKRVQEFLYNPTDGYDDLATFYSNLKGRAAFVTFFKQEIIPQLPNAPDFVLYDLQQNKVALENLKGKWSLIDFWGTWCGPCVAEMPKINKFYTDNQDKSNTNIKLITIACYDTADKVRTFLTNNSYSIPVLLSDAKVQHDYKVPGYPAKYIITPEGKMIPVRFGFDWQPFLAKLASL
ncbi:TlpA family protein disulfide reductase [Sphingobacterium psychroaquaticum]|uniref:Thiol-disulfide isomerase or thioredoxin n=1 Tax=Sphingobacterium psychroaquaticum TaxID=561061 RepID=A0A1X7LB18_9SPHI|nr:TlpA disulfide reductase family protein [Sphingobacterium psychroaquaticum]SMG51021.1 Thiol-disulfide isomerase or thioredoxin [Sphingobacterium psychroaquaticum]